MEHILFDDFNGIINALNDGIFISDADGNYLAINDSAAEIEKTKPPPAESRWVCHAAKAA